MKESLFNRSLKGVFVGGLGFIFNLIQSILLVPFIFKYWGEEKYGTWIILYGIVSLFRTLDIGHQNYIGNEFSKYYFQNISHAKKILGSSIRIAILIGAFQCLLFLAIFLLDLDKVLFGYSLDYSSFVGIFCMLLMWMFVGSVGGIIVRVIIPVGEYVRTQFWGIINKLCEISVIMVGIFLDLDLSILFIIMAIVLGIYSIIVMNNIKAVLPSLYPWWAYGNLKTGYYNFRVSLALTVNSFIDQFSYTSINSIISNIFSKNLIPSFTTIRTIANVMTQFSSILLQPLQSDIIEYHFKLERHKIVAILYINWLLLTLICYIPVVIILPYLGKAYEYWTDGQISFNYELFVAIFSGIFIVNFGRGIIYYLSLINDVKSLVQNNILRLFIILPSSILLAWYFNSLVALAWGITIGEIFGSIVFPLVYLRKHLLEEINKKVFALFLLLLTLCCIAMVLNGIFHNLIVSTIFLFLVFVLFRILWQNFNDVLKNKILSNLKSIF